MELMLEKNELVNMGKKLKGCTILCTSGRCWLTQENHSSDYILSPGKTFHVTSHGRLILTATEDCRIKVVAPTQRKGLFRISTLRPQVSLL